jgi:hypothetical protein
LSIPPEQPDVEEIDASEWLREIRGAWPGDESIDELLDALD